MYKRFLVVDDDPLSNKICEFTIKKVIGDAEVHCFQIPAEGLFFIAEQYAEGKVLPSVLFLDINMPVINGWAFLEAFSALKKEVQEQFSIFIVSTSIDHSDRDRAEAHPLVQDYLQKPISSKLLTDLFLLAD